jgi:hypothetical protein
VCILDPSDLGLIDVIQVLPATYDAINWLYLDPASQRLFVSTLDGVIFVYQVVP